MRILAGDYKSRKIDTINSPNTRPMMSKVRESIFSSLQFSIPHSDVLDLYAGSGSLGIEALSRGAQFSTFVEKSRNIQLCFMTPLLILKQELLRMKYL